MAGFDEPGVHRPDRDFVDPVTGDIQERKGSLVLDHLWRRRGVVAHGVVATGPVGVADQALRQGVADRVQAEQIAHFTLEAPRRIGQVGD